MKKKKKMIYGIILVAMIVVQLAYITYVFGWKREGYHSDENWQYGFANAYYTHQLYQDNEGNDANFNSWTDGKVLRDYLEVQKGQEFSFGSVAYNMSVDMSPPLSSMLLHAICSFFPDTFSWWYSYLINAVSFIVTMIALYLLGCQLFQSRNISLLVCFWYGCVSAALNCFIFLRMYGMLTAFAILMAYFYCRAYRKRFRKVIPSYICIAVLTFLGGMTHYYFFVLAFFMTGAFVLYQFFVKKWKAGLFNAALQLAAVGLVFLLWPVAVSKGQSGGSLYTAPMPYIFDLQISIRMIIAQVTGFVVGFPDIITFAYLVVILIFLGIIIAGVSFIFRNEKKYRDFWKKVRRGAASLFRGIPVVFKKGNKAVLLLILAVDATVLVIAKISSIYSMGIYGDRYFFFIMPLFLMVFVYVARKLAYVLLKKNQKKYRGFALGVLMVLCIVLNHIYYPCTYLFEKDSTVVLPELTKGANVIVAMDKKWHLTTMSSQIRNCKNFYAVMCEDIMSEDEEKTIQAIPQKDVPAYLLIEKTYLKPENGKYEIIGVGVADDETIQAMFRDYTATEVAQKMSELVGDGTYHMLGTMIVSGTEMCVYRMSATKD